ncbi:hypothetical protein GCM10011507_22480 [Edaphobacter acidisoli]|uniref:PDZ domain-containing protein n=1 Tax=Edaphobacter acidisoli TaxID=2040573 RepID=A0A916W6M1_9BACT|nr:PDZ domain-containing protein [Edaphobacter acidisoli]GGA70430.1 hypothetical protein GCM10011507_22480 [Edaphobacter acidisoli]
MSRKHHLALGVLAIAAVVCLPACVFAAAGVGSGHGSSSSKVTPGYLGIDVRDVTDDQVKPLKLKEARGAEIIDVDHDGPASKAGIQLHDVVVEMNGQMIDTQAQLRKMLREIPAGRMVSFVINRNGQQQTISVQMANREEVEREAWQQRYRVPAPDTALASGFLRSDAASAASVPAPDGPKGHRDFLGMTMILSSSFTGAKLEVMGPQLAEYFGAQGAGLLVRSVDADSPADQAGMKAGDVVVRVNQVPVASGTDWSKTIRENRGKPVSIVVLRDKREHTLSLTPDSKKRSSLRMGSGIEQYLNGVENGVESGVGRLVAEL